MYLTELLLQPSSALKPLALLSNRIERSLTLHAVEPSLHLHETIIVFTCIKVIWLLSDF